MNRTQLTESIARDAGISKAEAKLALESLTKNISQTLSEGGKVALIGWGTWSVTHKPAREGRNPQTGKIIQIAAKNVVKFKAGTGLSDAINKK